jgi:hypothetical protein
LGEVTFRDHCELPEHLRGVVAAGFRRLHARAKTRIKARKDAEEADKARASPHLAIERKKVIALTGRERAEKAAKVAAATAADAAEQAALAADKAAQASPFPCVLFSVLFEDGWFEARRDGGLKRLVLRAC